MKILDKRLWVVGLFALSGCTDNEGAANQDAALQDAANHTDANGDDAGEQPTHVFPESACPSTWLESESRCVVSRECVIAAVDNHLCAPTFDETLVRLQSLCHPTTGALGLPTVNRCSGFVEVATTGYVGTTKCVFDADTETLVHAVYNMDASPYCRAQTDTGVTIISTDGPPLGCGPTSEKTPCDELSATDPDAGT